MTANPAMATLNVNRGEDFNGYSYLYNFASCSNIYGMVNFNPYACKTAALPIRLTRCVLYPPNMNIQPTPTLGKPLGCKTIFVGGIPSNATEETIREVFEKFGRIVLVHMNDKFCYVQFNDEAAVDKAIVYSGYCMKIDDKNDEASIGRLHINYAESFRSIQDCMLGGESIEIPPLKSEFSPQRAADVTNMLRNEDSMLEALSILINWLIRNQCCKRNANTFYQMIGTMHSQVSLIKNEKTKYKMELQKVQEKLMQKKHSLSKKINTMNELFLAARLQKVWDHFSKLQRKGIEEWKGVIEEIEATHADVDSMEGGICERCSKNDDIPNIETSEEQCTRMDMLTEMEELYKENCDLRFRLKSSQAEVAFECSKMEERQYHQEAVRKMKETMAKAKEEFLSICQKQGEGFDDADHRTSKRRRIDAAVGEHSEGQSAYGIVSSESRKTSKSLQFSSMLTQANKATLSIAESDARFISWVSDFLGVLPDGASVSDICSYLRQTDHAIKASDVESLMKLYPSMFMRSSIISPTDEDNDCIAELLE